MSNSVSRLRRRLRRRRQRLLVNVVGVDANVDAWNSVNMHRFDVWCFFERSRTSDPAVGLGTSISGVEVPPPESRKVAHIPPTVTPVAGLIFETKNLEIFLERFFWREIPAREQVSRAVILEKFYPVMS